MPERSKFRKKSSSYSQNITTDRKESSPLTKKDRDFLHSASFDYGMNNSMTPIEGHGPIPYLQRKFQPLRKKVIHIRFKLEESSRTRRQIIYGSCISIMILSLIVGSIWKNDIRILPTHLEFSKKFINGDTIRITKEVYDPKTKSARIDLVSTSPTGIISPTNLAAEFQVAKPSPRGEKLPSLYLIPTFNNHFVVVVKDLYEGFGGLKILFKNNSTINQSQISSALQNGSNGRSQESLRGEKKINKIPTAGALHLTDKEIASINSGNGYSIGKKNYDSSKINTSDRNKLNDQLKILNKIQKKNTQYVLVSERKIQKQNIDITLNAKDITINDLSKEINRLKNDIQTNKDLINKNEPYIESLNRKIDSLTKDASIDPSYQDKIDDAKSAISSTQSSISNFKTKIKLEQNWIKRYNARIIKLRNKSILPAKVKSPSKAVIFDKNDKEKINKTN